MKILILDDEPEMIAGRYYTSGSYKAFYREMLGVDVTFTTTPKAAEATLSTEGFDVLLLDGFLIFKQEGGETLYGPDILADWYARGLELPPVYMISSDEKMCARGIDAGAKGKLSKDVFGWFPCMPEEQQKRRQALATLLK